MKRRRKKNFRYVAVMFGVVALDFRVIGFPVMAGDRLPQALEEIALGASFAKVETQLRHRQDVLYREDDAAANAGVAGMMLVSLKRADKPQISVFFSDAQDGHRVKEIWVNYHRGRPAEAALADAMRRYGDPTVIDRVPQDHRIAAAWGGTIFYEGDTTAAHQPRPMIDVEPKPHQRRTLALEIYADPATPDVIEETFHLATVRR
jgi:hypothetical protein